MVYSYYIKIIESNFVTLENYIIWQCDSKKIAIIITVALHLMEEGKSVSPLHIV